MEAARQVKAGWDGVEEPVAHRLIADLGHLFKGNVADSG